MINIKPFKKNKVLTHVQTSHPFFSIIQQANRGKTKEFQASLQTLRGPDSDIYEEATEITVVSSSDSFNLWNDMDYKLFKRNILCRIILNHLGAYLRPGFKIYFREKICML
jgi:hypothetical protein